MFVMDTVFILDIMLIFIFLTNNIIPAIIQNKAAIQFITNESTPAMMSKTPANLAFFLINNVAISAITKITKP